MQVGSNDEGSVQCEDRVQDCYRVLERRTGKYAPRNNNLRCPELSPWLQKVPKKKPKVMQQVTLPSLRAGVHVPHHYTYLRKNRYLDKYYQPLTLTFRFYNERECYIEEYRMMKSPAMKSTGNGQVSYIETMIQERKPPPVSSHSSSTTSQSPKEKKSFRAHGTRMGRSASSDYLNNAKNPASDSPSAGSSNQSQRIAIKIPKCESKTNRTFFPVILSRYRHNYAA